MQTERNESVGGKDEVGDGECKKIKGEIKYIITKMNRRKAAGSDGVPNEAWILEERRWKQPLQSA